MAQERSPTPEKQLLKLIEKGKDYVGFSPSAVKHRSLSFFSIGAWIGRASFLKESLIRWFKAGSYRSFDAKKANYFLSFCIFILLVYFVISSTFSVNSLVNFEKKMKSLQANVKKGSKSAGESEILGLKKTVSYYLEKARERDIFRMRSKRAANEDKSAPILPSGRVIEATAHLRLVGISWSDDPDAMIEDTQAKRTLFIKRGQMIGEVKVQAIFKDKVVLSYYGEEVELK
jgi:hypothetical protein